MQAATGQIIRVELSLPPRELSPNRRMGRGWGGLQKYKQQVKDETHVMLYQAVGPAVPQWPSVRARATFTVRSKKYVLDDDNALGWLKTTRDQIALEMGLNDVNWKWEEPVFHVGKPESLVIEVWEG